MWFLALIGIIYCPVFTLGCVLVHYDHAFLGVIAILISLTVSDNKVKID